MTRKELAFLCFALLNFFDAAHSYEIEELLRARFDPAGSYKTISSEHFKIHYQSELEDLAHETASIAESVHAVLIREFGYEPSGKTHIVMVENSDRTNVFTLAFPQNQIFLNPVLPLVSQEVNPYGNWIHWLLTHEYSHVLHMNRTKGWLKPLRFIGGSWVKPNMLSPWWLKEGVGVYLETKNSVGGRGRSAEYRMMMRMAALEGALDNPDFSSPDRMSYLRVRTWPWILRSYLLGYYTLAEMEQEIQASPVRAVADSGASGFSFLPEQILRRAKLPASKELWRKVVARAKIAAAAEADRIRATPLTKYTRLTEEGYFKSGPVVSPNGKWLVVSREDPESENALLQYTITDNGLSEPRELLPRFSGYQSAFSKSSRFLVFDDFRWYHRHHLRSDLFIFDLKEAQVRLRSRSMRARDPDVHPDGQHLVFVHSDRGKNYLMSCDTGFGNFQNLYNPKDYSRISSPRYSPDGNLIVFSLHDNATGGEALALIDQNGNMEKLTTGLTDDRHPVWTADGRQILFTSDRSGVFNLYALELESRRLFRITNLLGGAFYPAPDPAGDYLYFVDYTSKGYDLARMKWNPQEWEEVSLDPDGLHSAQGVKLENVAARISKPAAYSSLKYLRPQYLSPSILFRKEGAQYGFTIGAVDPLYFANYRLTLRYDTGSEQPVGYFFYFNGRRRLAWTTRFSRDVFPAETSRRNYDLLSMNLSLHLPLSRDTHLWYLEAGGVARRFGFERDLESSAGLWFSLTRNTVFRQLGESFPEYGSLLRITVQPMKQFGSGTRMLGIGTVDTERWDRLPWGKHHVLQSTLRGGAVFQESGLNYFLYGGGNESFPFTLQSEYRLAAHEPNVFAADRILYGSMLYAFPLATVERGLLSIPLFLDRLNIVAHADGAALWKRGERVSPWSVGAALSGDSVFAHIWPFQWSLGIYWGKSDIDWKQRVVFSLQLNK